MGHSRFGRQRGAGSGGHSTLSTTAWPSLESTAAHLLHATTARAAGAVPVSVSIETLPSAAYHYAGRSFPLSSFQHHRSILLVLGPTTSSTCLYGAARERPPQDVTEVTCDDSSPPPPLLLLPLFFLHPLLPFLVSPTLPLLHSRPSPLQTPPHLAQAHPPLLLPSSPTTPPTLFTPDTLLTSLVSNPSPPPPPPLPLPHPSRRRQWRSPHPLLPLTLFQTPQIPHQRAAEAHPPSPLSPAANGRHETAVDDWGGGWGDDTPVQTQTGGKRAPVAVRPPSQRPLSPPPPARASPSTLLCPALLSLTLRFLFTPPLPQPCLSIPSPFYLHLRLLSFRTPLLAPTYAHLSLRSLCLLAHLDLLEDSEAGGGGGGEGGCEVTAPVLHRALVGWAMMALGVGEAAAGQRVDEVQQWLTSLHAQVTEDAGAAAGEEGGEVIDLADPPFTPSPTRRYRALSGEEQRLLRDMEATAMAQWTKATAEHQKRHSAAARPSTSHHSPSPSPSPTHSSSPLSSPSSSPMASPHRVEGRSIGCPPPRRFSLLCPSLPPPPPPPSPPPHRPPPTPH